jgi:hypothetical protein
VQRSLRFLAAAALSAIALTGCRTTYTQADMPELERQRDEELTWAERRSEESPGRNIDTMVLQEEEVLHDTDR